MVLVGCVVSVAACGGGGDPTGALTDAFDGVDADVPQPDRVEPDHAESGGTPVEVRPPEFFLTGSLDAPAGTVLDPANCGRPDDSGPPYFEYYVPADWIVRMTSLRIESISVSSPGVESKTRWAAIVAFVLNVRT